MAIECYNITVYYNITFLNLIFCDVSARMTQQYPLLLGLIFGVLVAFVSFFFLKVSSAVINL